jgi:hypothetical protein
MNHLASWITALTLAASTAAAVSACGSSSSADPFEGTYDYMETHTFTITGAPPMMGTASGTLTIAAAAGGGYLVTIETAPDAGGGTCALTASASGTSLSFAAGQTCAVSGGGATGTATLTSGSASLSGATLALTLAYDISGMSPQGAFTATTVDHDTATKQ